MTQPPFKARATASSASITGGVTVHEERKAHLIQPVSTFRRGFVRRCSDRLLSPWSSIRSDQSDLICCFVFEQTDISSSSLFPLEICFNNEEVLRSLGCCNRRAGREQVIRMEQYRQREEDGVRHFQQDRVSNRQCIRQDLRHLRRCLPDHPLINAQWTRLDQALWNEVRRLRGRVNQRQGDRQELEDAILSLPLRLGGLGVLSHLSVAPHALAASNEAGDRHIDAFMNISPSDQGSPPPAVKSQHERCQDMWETTQTDLIDTLDDTERKLLAEAASPLGRKWLNTIPFYQPLCLTDFEVSTALNYRTLACSPLTTSSWCSRPNSLGHDELCMSRPRQTVARHDPPARMITCCRRNRRPVGYRRRRGTKTSSVRREDQEGGWERSSACQEADFEGFERTSSWDGTTERIDK